MSSLEVSAANGRGEGGGAAVRTMTTTTTTMSSPTTTCIKKSLLLLSPSTRRQLHRRLELFLVVMFLVFFVQFLWLTSLLQQQQQRNTVHLFASSSTTTNESTTTIITKKMMNDVESRVFRAASAKAPAIRDKNKQEPVNNNNNNIKRKRIQRGTPEWKRNHWDPGLEGLANGTEVPLKVGFPVFVASLPKSGTTSMWQYFQCGGHPASHQWIKMYNKTSTTANNNQEQQQDQRNNEYTELTGRCMHDNILRNRPPFEGCGTQNERVHTDAGYARFAPPALPLEDVATTTGAAGAAAASALAPPLCYFPSISALDAIEKHYPNATIILVVRNSSSWYDSMNAWADGTLLTRWTTCGLPHFPTTVNVNTVVDGLLPAAAETAIINRQAVEAFYDWHTNNIRQFAKQHPALRYIEVSLESNDTGRILEEQVGIPATCWGKCTPSAKFCQRIIQ